VHDANVAPVGTRTRWSVPVVEPERRSRHWVPARGTTYWFVATPSVRNSRYETEEVWADTTNGSATSAAIRTARRFT
jgi:hypothetical protein